MNRKQRMQNRANAERLRETSAPVCPNCGQRGRHYIHDPVPKFGGDCSGYYCPAKIIDEGIESQEREVLQRDFERQQYAQADKDN